MDDPSEDALFMLIDDLNGSDNTFVVIQPDENDPAWFTSVAVLDEGGYEVVRRDTVRREHDVTTSRDRPDKSLWETSAAASASNTASLWWLLMRRLT
ncbi:hypothetical protein ACFV9D_24545 [Streptomyces sp. NPDC059875]|uniref:hypothetical protein n=1 Tax=unclassified Streptomyces TaxID=2593676 RepID=UPI0036519642